MTKNKLSIEKSVSELERKLLEHIGSNGHGSNEQSVHLPVDADNAGFATPDMYAHDQQLFTKRKWVVNTDLLKLAPGYYEGSGFTNHPVTTNAETPTTWISNVDVIDGGGGRRTIYLTDNMYGYRWMRTLHTGGDPKSGSGAWIQFTGLVTLWKGYSKLNEAVTLNTEIKFGDGNNKYSTIIVKYTTDRAGTGLAFGNSKGILVNALNSNDDSDSKVVDFYEAKLTFPTSSTAQVVRNKTTHVFSKGDSDSAYLSNTYGEINVVEIMGVES